MDTLSRRIFRGAQRDDRAHAEIFGRTALQNVVADARMVLHRSHLDVGQRTGLQQDGVRDADLADVVHRRGNFQDVYGLRRQAELQSDQRRIFGHAGQMIAGCLVAEFAGLGKLGQRFQLALVDLRDRLVDLVLQNARLIGQDDLVPAKVEEVGAPRPGLMLIQRLDEEVGRAGFESFVAHAPVVHHGNDDDRYIDAMRQRADLANQLHAVEFRQLVVGQHHIDAVIASELERPTRRVEKLQVELPVDLADDFREQQAAAEQIVDDHNGVPLRTRHRQFGYDRAFVAGTLLRRVHVRF